MADKAFDASNPPLKVTHPGGVTGYQEYPRHLHRLGGDYCVVTNDAEKAAKLAEGWALSPADAKAAAEAAKGDESESADDDKADKPARPRRGRKPKAEAAA